MTRNNSKKPSGQKQPWWRDTMYVAMLATLFAALVPITTCINGWFQAKREQQKQIHELHIQFLDRAIDPGWDVLTKRSILQFIVQTLEPGDRMAGWALDRLKELDTVKIRCIDSANKKQVLDSLKKMLDFVKQKNMKESIRNMKDSIRNKEKIQKLEADIQKKTAEFNQSMQKLATAKEIANLPPSYSIAPTQSEVDRKGALYSYLNQKIDTIIINQNRRWILIGKNFGTSPGEIEIVLKGITGEILQVPVQEEEYAKKRWGLNTPILRIQENAKPEDDFMVRKKRLTTQSFKLLSSQILIWTSNSIVISIPRFEKNELQVCEGSICDQNPIVIIRVITKDDQIIDSHPIKASTLRN